MSTKILITAIASLMLSFNSYSGVVSFSYKIIFHDNEIKNYDAGFPHKLVNLKNGWKCEIEKNDDDFIEGNFAFKARSLSCNRKGSEVYISILCASKGGKHRDKESISLKGNGKVAVIELSCSQGY